MLNLVEYKDYFNTRLDNYLDDFTKDMPDILRESVKYAIVDGGKRIRPILLFLTAEAFGIDRERVIKYAVAIEMIHAYSLVHDDLPSMDNDDYRRGKFSTHKKFGEAYGILAGDALLNMAFEVALTGENTYGDIEAIKIIADYAGAHGMIKGQVLDLLNEKNSNPTLDVLFDIYTNKTSKLLTCPLLVASCLNGKKYFNELKTFGENLGILFQVTDDIMDVEGDFATIGKTPNKDAIEDKLTAVKVLGIDSAKDLCVNLYIYCKTILNKIPNSASILELLEIIYKRKK